ncbi:cyclase [Mycobacterium intermedium]|uniref:Cyclase n=1 Tax=Mycobacterium intermedium TaxID=28445 RepID=A0A1E3SAE1_MYCIE|nr:adenylate/guanylate cyclase domain-containing protein [Mycobacterium intermedium]MCV6967731.1 AAA family ATPase [Mycobacterium intermedium]ODQ99120.1 cyclase [Mycobacterium intermedium]OPE46166.1 cyclase [Mycobacterium intermedium]ORB05520.1 cyclase [Mycobacterium intermedium]
MTDSRPRQTETASIDELLDRAVAAVNRGDRAAATDLAGQVLAADSANAEAEDLLAAPADPGEIRRLTIFFADLVDSTVLSTQVEPETYRLLVGRYRDQVLRAVNRYEGHIGSTKGDGLLAVFGHPVAHEDDVRRAVQAGLEITREVVKLSDQARRRLGIEIHVRVGVHRGLVYLDTAQDDVYGLAANLAARVSGLAAPDTVVVSEAVAALVGNNFELEPCAAVLVKGVADPIAHYRVVAERSSSPRSVHGPLVGRDGEVAHLEKSWAQAQDGTLSTPGVVFRGEPGIGKSRLAAAAAQLAGDLPLVELIGSPFHVDVGLRPVRTLLERRCSIGRNTDQAERLRLLDDEICRCGLEPPDSLPLLAPVLGIDAGYPRVAAEGQKLYDLITHAVQDYLAACLGRGAGLVIAEDVHWFDQATRALLGSLLGAADGRLLLVMTGRPGDWLPAEWPCTVFDLAPLTDQQTHDLIAALDPNLTADQRTAVAARCDGVPFYIEQVIRGLGESGVPETLYEPLFARLRASPKVVPVVEAAAVIGRHIDQGLLRSVVELSDHEIDEVISELEDALVIEPWTDGNWRFRHELLREVAAELAPPSVRRDLHAKVADAMIGNQVDADPDWQLAAGHFEHAERFRDAAMAYERAAAGARLRGALGEARSYLTRGLDQIDRAPAGPDRDHRELALRLERGRLAGATEGYQSPAAAVDYERCLQLAGSDLRDEELFATLAALAGYYVTRADLDRAVQVVESLRAGVRHGRQWFAPVIDAYLGMVALLRGEFRSATAYLEAAIAGLAAVDRDGAYLHEPGWYVANEPLTYAYAHLACARFMRGDLVGGERELERSARHSEQLGFPAGPYTVGYAAMLEIGMRIDAGQLDTAASLAAKVSELGERHGFAIWQLVGATCQAATGGMTALAADDQAALGGHITTMIALLDYFRTFEANSFRTSYDGVIGRLLIGAGQLDAARARLDIGLSLARDTGMRFYDAELLRLRSRTHEGRQRQLGVDAALKLARHQGATLFELRAALDDFEIRGESAVAAVGDALKRMPGGYAWPEVTRAKAVLGILDR